MSFTADTATIRTLTVASAATLPSGTIRDATVAAGANIAASKVVHRVPLTYCQPTGSAVADATELLHIARGTTGTIVAIECAVESAAIGDSTVAIDLLLGNASTAFATVLSSAISITSSLAVRTPLAGTLNTTSFTDGDILKLDVNATVGTGTLPQGLVVTVFIDETPA